MSDTLYERIYYLKEIMKNILKTITALPVIGLLLFAGATPAIAAEGDVNPVTDKCFINLDVTEEQMNDPEFRSQDFSPYLVCETITIPEGYNDSDLGITPTITDSDRIYYLNANDTSYTNLTNYSPSNIVTEGGYIVGIDKPEFIYNTYNNGDITSLPLDVNLSLLRSIGGSVENNKIIGVEVKTLDKSEWVANEPAASYFGNIESVDVEGVTTKLVEDGKTIPSSVVLPVLDTITGFYNEGSISLTLPSMTSKLVKENSTTFSYDFVVTVFEEDMFGEILEAYQYYTIQAQNIPNCTVGETGNEVGVCVGGTALNPISVTAYYNDVETRTYTANVFVDVNGDGIRNNGEELYTGTDFAVNGGIVFTEGVLTGSREIRFSYSGTPYERNPLYSGSSFTVTSLPSDYTLTTEATLPYFNTNEDGSFNSSYVAEFGIQGAVEVPEVVPPVVEETVPVIVTPEVIKNGGGMSDGTELALIVSAGVILLGGLATLLVVSRKKNSILDEVESNDEEKK